MPIRNLVATWLWLASTVPCLTAQAPGDAAGGEQVLRKRVLAARAELAEAAFALDLFREASASAGAVLNVEPEHGIDALRQRLKLLPADDFVRRYRDATQKSGKAYRKRARERLQPLAAEAFGLAEAAAKAGDQAPYERLLVLTLELDPDHQKALPALKQCDYEVIFNYGVVPGPEKEQARKLLKSLGGGFLGRAEIADELEQWVDAWGLRTRHYRFVTDAPHGTVFAFAQACEDLYAALDGFMTANKQPLRDFAKPSTVYLFRSKVDYECILRLLGVEPADSDDALGFYAPATKVGYFYHDAAFYGADTTLLCETFYHEGAHQMFDLRWRTPWRGRSNGPPLNWVEEGFAVYLESLAVDANTPDRRSEFGTVIDDDLATAIAAAAAGELMPMQSFVPIADDAWNAYELAYPHAALVVHWLLTADGGKRRSKAFELLAAERQNGGLRKGTVFDLLGSKAEEVDQALRQHAAAIARTLKQRQYPAR